MDPTVQPSVQNSQLQLLQIFLAETFGTAILVLFGCMNLAFVPPLGLPPVLHIAFGFGFICGTLVLVIGRISGCHINPAVTLASLLMDRLSIIRACIYFAAQILGAVIGFGAILSCTPKEFFCKEEVCAMCVTQPGPNVSPVQAALVEFYGTGVLIMTVCSIWDPRKDSNDASSALKVALSITAIVCATAGYSGASLNPARSFAPALVTGHWKNFWIYLAGPFGASVAFGLFYRFTFLKASNLTETNYLPE